MSLRWIDARVSLDARNWGVKLVNVDTKTIEALLPEGRKFEPGEEFSREALVTDKSLYDQAADDFEGFWATQAREYVTWRRQFDTTLDWQLPFAKWFVGGELNASYQCLDRHV